MLQCLEILLKYNWNIFEDLVLMKKILYPWWKKYISTVLKWISYYNGVHSKRILHTDWFKLLCRSFWMTLDSFIILIMICNNAKYTIMIDTILDISLTEIYISILAHVYTAIFVHSLWSGLFCNENYNWKRHVERGFKQLM